MHTYAYLELFKLVFSLNKQIFQLFDKSPECTHQIKMVCQKMTFAMFGINIIT